MVVPPSTLPLPACCTLFSVPVFQLLAPSLPCLPGLIEGKLEKAQSPYTSFSLLIKGSLLQTGWGRWWAPHCQGTKMQSRARMRFASLSLLFLTSWAGELAALITLSQGPVLGFVFILLFLKHCLPEMDLGPDQEPLTAALLRVHAHIPQCGEEGRLGV